MAKKFDKERVDSPFLSFVAKEFFKRGTPFRLQLAQKEFSCDFVGQMGLKAAEKKQQLDNINNLSSSLIGERAVLKYAKGWSSRGVMLLEKIGDDLYFDHMNLMNYSLNQIINIQIKIAASFGHKEPFWIIEEFLESAQTVGSMTFDYKFHVFQGEIGFIAQIDRNSYPPKVALFDGNFKPLKLGEDYLLDSREVHPGVPLIPLNAPEMLWWANKLSKSTDSPFVRVDLYDTPKGPVFGEFTFSPGPVHKKMYVFSKKLLNEYDAMLINAQAKLDGKWSENSSASLYEKLAEQNVETVKQITKMPHSLYGTLTGVAYNDGSRGALRMIEHYKNLLANEKMDVAKDMYKLLIQGWENIRINLRKKSQQHLVEIH